ncbi:sensor histidine kinase [Nocardiopsis nanhaiensis]
MRLSRVPHGHLALAAVLVLLVLAPRWPLLLMAVPVPALLTGRLGGDPRVAGLAYSVLALLGAGFLVLGGFPVGMWVTGGSLTVFAVLLPWLLGLYLRSTSALEQEGWERARTLEREALLVAERARMRERSRIAQDMHDAVGHELSLLALGAGALETAPDLAGERRAQARQLREVAGRAADRLMEAVGVLRADTGSAPLDPAGDSVAELVRRSREAGMDVSLEREGGLLEQDGGHGELPLAADRALYRVVQEALTNAAKHAPGSAPRVLLSGSPDQVSVRVANGPAIGSRASARAEQTGRKPGSGSGLVGLRERVRLVGGELTAGAEGDVWVVSARIPVHGPAPRSRTGAPPGEPALETAEGPAEGPAQAPLTDGMPDGARDRSGHRRARRRALWAIGVVVGVPILVALAGYMLVVALTAHQAATATLDPEVFDGLAPGQDRAEVEALLPEEDLYGGLFEARGRPTDPEGLECSYYRSDADVFAGGYDRYRLCFDSETLVSAEVVPGEVGP